MLQSGSYFYHFFFKNCALTKTCSISEQVTVITFSGDSFCLFVCLYECETRKKFAFHTHLYNKQSEDCTTV